MTDPSPSLLYIPLLTPIPLSLLFPPIPFSSLRSIGPPQTQLEGLGERCELLQQGLGPSPSRNRIWCILALKYYDIWSQQL